jgi:hypothetical protein
LIPKFLPSVSRVFPSGSASGPRVSTSREPRITNHAVSSTAATLTRPLDHNSLSCHSHESMGGGGYPPRVHIPLILHHLVFSALHSFNFSSSQLTNHVTPSGSGSTSHQSQITSHILLNPYPPSHTRSRFRKSLCAITYVFHPNLSPCAPSHTKTWGEGCRPFAIFYFLARSHG